MAKGNRNIGGNVFPRRLDRPMSRAVKAEGVWIEDTEGRRYLDASGGAIVVNVGHGREEIARAVCEQISAYDYIHPTMFTTPVVEALATALAAHTPAGLDRFYFLSSGSEAVEAAIKLARQIHLSSNRPERFRIIARHKSYHGLTLGALSAMGRTSFREPYAPMLREVLHIPPPYCFRCAYGLAYPGCGLQCAKALAYEIENAGPQTISAFLAETVSGGTLAAYPPPEGYWNIIRETCDRYQVLLILDEVMCGMGRTGRWFACEHYGVCPDIMTLGKGLSGGTLPLSAVGLKADHFDLICRNGDEFVHGGTFSHHPVTAAAGLATIRIIEREKLIERVEKMGAILEEALKTELEDHPHVGNVRGLGLLWGIELVANKDEGRPFPRQQKIAEQLWEKAFQRGVLTYKSTGLAGPDGDAILIAPPFVVGKEELQHAATTLRKALDDLFN
ncbi:MAG: aspartate aminotransferase family protein [Desulfosarcina sp.]|nr:aspartate aminotransferase family protein [Desulfobacterales bacterium]